VALELLTVGTFEHWRQCYADPQTPIWPVFLPDRLILLLKAGMRAGN
jgi:hypothetical protein